jgi:hypothetical protein
VGTCSPSKPAPRTTSTSERKGQLLITIIQRCSIAAVDLTQGTPPFGRTVLKFFLPPPPSCRSRLCSRATLLHPSCLGEPPFNPFPPSHHNPPRPLPRRSCRPIHCMVSLASHFLPIGHRYRLVGSHSIPNPLWGPQYEAFLPPANSFTTTAPAQPTYFYAARPAVHQNSSPSQCWSVCQKHLWERLSDTIRFGYSWSDL